MRGRANTPAVLVACVAFALVLLPVSGALASSGEITRAEANGDWTQGSLAGTASWGGCSAPAPPPSPFPPFGREALPACTWEAFITVGPGSDSAECGDFDRQWPNAGEHVTLAWSSGQHAFAGSATFDLPEVPLSGESGQLACLTVVESYEVWPPCLPGQICAQYIGIIQQTSVLDSALLIAPPTPPPPEPSPPAGEGASITLEPPSSVGPTGHVQRGGKRAGSCGGRLRHGQKSRQRRSRDHSACVGVAGARDLAR